jgi:hypothetical protein
VAVHSGVPETTVGIEGVYYARVRGPALEAKPVDESGPVVLRVADVTEDENSAIYELRFIGTLPGSYDLLDFLVRADGQPITGLDPMPVVIGELLPPDHQGELEGLARPRVRPWWRYRLLLAGAALSWLVLPAWLIVRRIVRRRAEPRVIRTADPTLADQLRPLVEAAVAGQLSSADQARLELLLIAHWRERLDLTDCPAAEALAQMRRRGESGELLRQLERWLHHPPGRFNVDVAAILKPYRAFAPVDEDHVPREEVAT